MVAMLVAAGLAALYLLNGRESSQHDGRPTTGDPAFPFPALSTGRTAALEPGTHTATTERLANPLERSADLRATFEQYKSSKNASERNIALRAWTACFPAFTAPDGQAVTLENVTRGLPRDARNYPLRVDAYRSLLGRCKRFLDLSHDDIVAESREQENAWNAGDARSPGESALQSFNAGKVDESRSAVRSILASGDAYAIGSMSELVADAESPLPRTSLSPALRSLAFSVAACELGLECGPGSLTALLLCANNGACEGGVVDRYLSELPDQAEYDAVLQESRRVIDAVKANDMSVLGF